ncbi:hypothetical protein GGX14DRAFT_479749 [Mycena pura]|uniref:G domain-containing protein n=1 Tax=Mycena pura TaxID=153505 RepID=A0AAD6UU24_9AGAR|nr:hypothetical protein GGX14DRAFT_479749 [Mycena pura]
MAHETLPLVTREILAECPRLRVLVVGKSGVGKSSLISHAFGIDMKSISHQERGTCDTNFEIISPQNSRFVLHDSMGFEHGDTQNTEAVNIFLRSRSGKDVALQERVHLIWLCIQVPHSGSRVFETGDEELLKLASDVKVPVVVVFTQFDLLVTSMYDQLDISDDTPEEKIDELSAEKAQQKFQEVCVAPLNKVNPELRYATSSGLSGGRNAKPDRRALAQLIEITQGLVEKEVEGEAWIVSAMAQRASAQGKINASIDTKFFGSTLEKCLDTVHEEMVDSWNFYDPNDLLLGPEFRKRIKELAQLVTPDDVEAKSLFPNLDAIQSWVGLVGASIAAAAGPAFAAIALMTWFVTFITNVYRETPKALRCIMGYIIDLTLVLNELFLVVLAIRPPRPLTADDIEMALENYKYSDLGMVHHDIRQYVKADLRQALRPQAAEVKVKELILEYSSDSKPRRRG